MVGHCSHAVSSRVTRDKKRASGLEFVGAPFKRTLFELDCEGPLKMKLSLELLDHEHGRIKLALKLSLLQWILLF
jgi:hypothetical protein